MLNCKDRGRIAAYFKTISQHLPGMTEKKRLTTFEQLDEPGNQGQTSFNTVLLQVHSKYFGLIIFAGETISCCTHYITGWIDLRLWTQYDQANITLSHHR
jgi:hypothetical protein